MSTYAGISTGRAGDARWKAIIVDGIFHGANRSQKPRHVSAQLFDTKELGTDAVTLTVAVSDTGIGIAPDVIDRIFNEFTQASYDTAMTFGGSGLGLTITRRLLALYGSTVHVSSAPGEGSTFSFDVRLPLPPPQAKNAATSLGSVSETE